MLNAKTILFGLPVLVISAIAGQAIFGSKITGDLVQASFSPDPFNFLTVVPANMDDSTAYQVFWHVCTLHPDFDHRYCISAGGLIPRSAVKVQQVDTAGLDIDTSLFTVLFPTSVEDCTSGTCTQSLLPSPPLVKGSFTIYRGPGSFVEQSNGSIRRDDLFPFGGITSSSTFSGNRTRYSANFAGVIGPLTFTPPPSGSNGAQLSIMKGQTTSQLVYPPL